MPWFHARSSEGGPGRFAAPGVFQAAGIVDGALLRVTRTRLRQRAWLRMAVNTRMWGLSARPGREGDAAAPPGQRLTITASGVPRPLDTEAMRRWL